jgi:hypothetical protein
LVIKITILPDNLVLIIRKDLLLIYIDTK